MLTNSDITELTEFRRALHRRPELSGEEAATADAIAAALAGLSPERIMTGLGGYGVAAVFDSGKSGPTLMFRAELDALPIQEIGERDHRSVIDGKGHLCGHDGHMVILLALARMVARQRPVRGRVVLLFQPAEETGAGAAAVLADPKFIDLRPDMCFALHNMPGLPMGHVTLCRGPANCASEGMRLHFTGRTAHASMPETGTSPALALARLIPAVMAEGTGGSVSPGFRLVTITHARMGEPAFGIAPGEAELWLTLRTLQDADMTVLRDRVTVLAQTEAAQAGLGLRISHHDRFSACSNHPQAVAALTDALGGLGLVCDHSAEPMRASEDFGLFGRVAPSAMILLGAGQACPALHNPDYDFPDDLIPIGAQIFARVMRNALG